MPRNHLSPPTFPEAWASDWGEDHYGLWMAWTYQDIRQAFRWIPPGSFMMGSPEDEEGRFDWEDYHSVELTQGFWLAETTCTQALWQAVMGNNPSRFKGNNRPVEQVSWDDVQQFIQTVNANDALPQVALPSEAEWEYACRAGTSGAFNFNGELNLSKVNYRRIWEWDSGKSGKGSVQQMVEVTSLNNPNVWGLHEMHGNVWEWCQDGWQLHLDTSHAQDPKGVETGAHRVIRGGLWKCNGRYVCSVSCKNRSPYFRNSDVGFRLRLGL